MSAGLGLCGSHRTGKTTLAREFAKRNGVPFIQTSASQVFLEAGLDPAVDYPFEIRLTIQEEILRRFMAEYSKAEADFITDRTPIDMLAYTLADVRQQTLTPELDARLQKYIKDCIEATNRFFTILVVIQPGLPLKEEPGKAALVKSYIDHVAHLVMGLVVNEAIHATHFYIPSSMLSLEKRVECIENAIVRTVERHHKHIENAKDSGSPVIFH